MGHVPDNKLIGLEYQSY